MSNALVNNLICYDAPMRANLEAVVEGREFGSPLDYSVDAKPLIDGDDVSWIATGLKVGNDQGDRNCCALQAIGNWINAVHKKEISDKEVKRVHWSGGQGNVGMSFQRAFNLADAAGWFPVKYRGILPTGKLSSLKDQPLLAGYAIRRNWNRVGEHGRISTWEGAVTAHHGVVIMAKGRVKEEPPRVWIENSWGYEWACEGIASLSEDVHERELKEMWVIVK